MAHTRLNFLGTGAAGGTPGQGRSRRRESSLLVTGRLRLLLDVTRDFGAQAADIDRLDAVVLTHAHADAAGGLAQLRHWWRRHDQPPLPVYGHPGVLEQVATRFKRRDHIDLQAVRPQRRQRVDRWVITGVEVPHDRRPTYPTMAWRIDTDGAALVYASDVARPVQALADLSRGTQVLVVDGATWRRRIFSHLRIDEDVQVLCGWDVERIWLTQIGRSAPPHDELARAVAGLCHRAAPAFDGLGIDL